MLFKRCAPEKYTVERHLKSKFIKINYKNIMKKY